MLDVAWGFLRSNNWITGHHPLALQGPRPGAPAGHWHHRPRDRQERRQEGFAEVAHQDRLL